MRTKIIKSVRLWVVFMAFAMAIAVRTEAIEVIEVGVYGFLDGDAYSVNNASLKPGPNGTLIGTVRRYDDPYGVPYGGVEIYTPISGSDSYEGQFIEIECASNHPVAKFTVAQDGTIVAQTVAGGGNKTGITATISNNPPHYTVIGCVDNPPINGNPVPSGHTSATVVKGDTIVYCTGAPTNAYATNFYYFGTDFSTDPPQLIFGVVNINAANPNGVTLAPSGGTPHLVKASVKANTVTSNDLSGLVLYGTAEFGGSANDGIIYRINGDGTGFQILHNFGSGSSNGTYPKGNVIISSDGGTLYGTTSGGGANNGGTVYSISTNGSSFTLLSSAVDNPQGDLYLVGDTLYGTDKFGGRYSDPHRNVSANGEIYSVKTNGTGFASLYSFAPLSTATNSAGLQTNFAGANPIEGVLVLSNGIAGTTSTGGANGYGTVFFLPFAEPTVTITPSQWESMGDFIDFYALADGIGPFGYQWYFNNAPMVGQTYNPYFNFFNSTNQEGSYSVVVTNTYGSVTSSVSTLNLSIVADDSFESGAFSGWTLSSGATNSSIQTGHDGIYDGNNLAYLGGNTTALNYLSQTLQTVAGQTYSLSFWLNTSEITTNNEFMASWGGLTVFDQTNMPIGTNPNLGSYPLGAGWMNMQYTVLATNTSTLLQFGFQTGSASNLFVLDDVRVAPAPVSIAVQSDSLTGQTFNINWSAIPNAVYQVQYSTNLASTNWQNVNNPITATNGTVSVGYPATNEQGYYRVIYQP